MNTSFLDGRFKCNAPACNIENKAAEATLHPESSGSEPLWKTV